MTLPVWTAGTAYLQQARVTKTVPDGTVWMCEIAGTSGGVEPTWPTVEPWTVVDGGVTWGIADATRMNLTTGLVAALNAFKAANPTLLRSVKGARPKSFTNVDLPLVYMGGRDEQIRTMAQMRQRTISGVLGVVDNVPDNYEVTDRFDILLDGLTDCLSAAYHAAGGVTILGQTASAMVPEDEGGVQYFEYVMAYTVGNQTGRI